MGNYSPFHGNKWKFIVLNSEIAELDILVKHPSKTLLHNVS